MTQSEAFLERAVRLLEEELRETDKWVEKLEARVVELERWARSKEPDALELPFSMSAWLKPPNSRKDEE